MWFALSRENLYSPAGGGHRDDGERNAKDEQERPLAHDFVACDHDADTWRQEEKGEPFEEEIAGFLDVVDLDDFEAEQQQQDEHSEDIPGNGDSYIPMQKVACEADSQYDNQLN